LTGINTYIQQALNRYPGSSLVNTSHSHPEFQADSSPTGIGPSVNDIRNIKSWTATFPDASGLVVTHTGDVLEYLPQATTIPVRNADGSTGLRDRYPEEFTTNKLFNVNSPNISAIDSNDFDSFANGGFLLYPNKPNTNMMRSVYAK